MAFQILFIVPICIYIYLIISLRIIQIIHIVQMYWFTYNYNSKIIIYYKS